MDWLTTLFKDAGNLRLGRGAAKPGRGAVPGTPFTSASPRWMQSLTSRLDAGGKLPADFQVHVDMSKALRTPGATAIATPTHITDKGRVGVVFPKGNVAEIPAHEVGKLRHETILPAPPPGPASSRPTLVDAPAPPGDATYLEKLLDSLAPPTPPAVLPGSSTTMRGGQTTFKPPAPPAKLRQGESLADGARKGPIADFIAELKSRQPGAALQPPRGWDALGAPEPGPVFREQLRLGELADGAVKALKAPTTISLDTDRMRAMLKDYYTLRVPGIPPLPKPAATPLPMQGNAYLNKLRNIATTLNQHKGKLLLGGGALGTSALAGLPGGPGGPGGSPAGGPAAAADTLQNALVSPEQIEAAKRQAANLQANPVMKYAPIVAGAGLGAYGLYRLVQNLRKKQEEEDHPRTDFVPKVAADKFADAHPLVAGFLAKCAHDDCSSNDLRHRIQFAVASHPETAAAFIAAGFTKEAIELPSLPRPAAPTANPSVTPPAPAAFKPPALPTPTPAPAPAPAPAPPRPAAGPTPSGPMPGGARPTAPQAAQPVGSFVSQPLGPVEKYMYELNRNYIPWSDAWKNTGDNYPDNTLRRTGQAALGVGVGAGVAAAALPAAIGSTVIGGSGLATGTAVAGTAAANAPVAAQVATPLAVQAGKTYLGMEALNTLPAMLSGENPLRHTMMGAATDSINPFGPANATVPLEPQQATFTAADLPPEFAMQLPKLQQNLQTEMSVLFPTATPKQLAAKVQEAMSTEINTAAAKHKMETKARAAASTAPVAGQPGQPGQPAPQSADPFVNASNLANDPATPGDERAEAFASAATDWTTKNGIPPDQAEEVIKSIVADANAGKLTEQHRMTAWDNVKQQFAQTKPEIADDPEAQKSLWESFSALDPGSQMLLALGMGVGAIGLVNALSDPNAGAGTALMAMLGIGVAGATAAHNGMLGETAKNFVQPATSWAADHAKGLMGQGRGETPGATSAPLSPDAFKELATMPFDARRKQLGIPDQVKSLGDKWKVRGALNDLSHKYDQPQLKQLLQGAPADMIEQLRTGVEKNRGQFDPGVADEILGVLGPAKNEVSIRPAVMDPFQQTRFQGGNPNIPQAAVG